MGDIASLLFIAGGALSYPVFLHLSLKKSLSIVSEEKVANGRILLSLVILYLEAVVLAMLSMPLTLIPLPYLGSLIALSAIVLLASYTLKAMFDLSFRRGILAFGLWQVLCLALGATLMATILAATSETILTFPLVTALIPLTWWMWRGRQGVVAREVKTGSENGIHVGFGDSERKIAALAMVALLTSTLLAPSMLGYVTCEPQEVKGEEVEVEGDFSWVNETIRAYIAWVNSTLEEENITQIDATTVAKLAATWLWDASKGFSEGIGEFAVSLVNVPGALMNLHDVERDLTYLSLIDNVTSIQEILRNSQPDLQRNPSYGSTSEGSRGLPSSYAKDATLADELASLSKKGFKISVAEDPSAISNAFAIERYVESTSWSKAAIDLLTQNAQLANEVYGWIERTTGDKRDASYGWLRTFGVTAPLVECAEAFKSGDPGRIGRSVAQAALSYTMYSLMIKAAWDVVKAKGVAAGLAKAAYDIIVPAQGLYAVLKGGFSAIKGALSDVGDEGLRTYLEGVWSDLKIRLTGTEYNPPPFSGDDLDVGIVPIGLMSDGYELVVKPVVTLPEEKCIWTGMLDDANVAKKISSDSWVKSFIKEIDDYQRLDQIGEGETEILGLKIDMKQDVLKEGYPGSIGKSYFELKLVDTGTRMRVYDDNVITIFNKGTFERIPIEQLEGNEPLKIFLGKRPDGGTYLGTRVTTIFMRDHLEEIGFYDDFTIGQETERAFRAKGIVNDKGVANDGPYVTIRYEVDTGKGIIVRDVRISSDGAKVNERSIVDFETDEDGAVYLHYKQGDDIHKTPIQLPDIIMNQVTRGAARLVKVDCLTTGFDYNDIQVRTEAADLFEELDIQSSKDFTRRVAYATQVGNKDAFNAEYGEGKCEALWGAADAFSKSTTEEALENIGLKAKVELKAGVRPSKTGEDISITTQDGIKLKLDIEYAGEGQNSFSSQVNNMAQKFREGKADLGIIFSEGEYYVYINSATKYESLANIAMNIERTGSRSLKDFTGVSTIIGLGLLRGYMTGVKGEAVSITDDAGRWIGEFQDSYLDHTAVDGSTVFGSWLALTSVDRSYLQNVRSTGTTIAESTVTNCNVSAKLIYDSLVQNTLAVCSTITNCVIDMCRILNSTLVSVVDLVGSYIEDSFASYSANISNCTVVGSNLMSVVNLVNTTVTGSNLTLVANVDNTKIDHSDISYSANISNSDIVDTMLRGCTVQGSRLTSCTATDSVIRNVNATNTNLSCTSAELSNLVNVNATNSKLTRINVEYSNLKDVVLKNTNVIGTDLTYTILADKTVMYGRVVDSNENIIDPFRKVGMPNYSGKSASSSSPSASKTTSSASSQKGGGPTYYVMPSSSSTQRSNNSQTKSSQQTTTTTSPQTAQKPVSRGANIWIN